MESVWVAVVIAAAVASRPIEARLWRSGRRSDRTTALLVLGRFPLLAFIFGLMSGGPILLVLALTALALLPTVVFYQPLGDLLRRQRAA